MAGPSLPAGCEPACPACRHRTLPPAERAAQKQAYLERALSPWAARLAPLRLAPQAFGYRERVSLNARWDEAAGWRFGLVRRRGRSDEFISIPDCPVHAPRVNAALAALAGALPPQPRFPLAYVAVSGAQITLIVKARAAVTGWAPALSARLRGIGFEGLWLHRHPSAGRRLFARSGWDILWGAPRSRDAAGCLYGPTAFAQVQPQLHEAALAAMDAHLKPAPGAVLIDLYCGIGKGLSRAAAAGAAAIGVELSGEGVECAQANAPQARLLRGACALRLPQVDSFLAEHSGARRLLAMNPPRSGLERPVLAWAAALAPERAAYLSCSAGTLARDLGELESAGLRVEKLLPFDFFPLTHHVEVLALLRKL